MEAFFTCIPKMRVQVSETRFRVPDLALISIQAPDEQITHTPPMLCIEILSPEDTMSRTLVRVRDVLHMGVPEVWVFDPATRTVLIAAGSSTTSHSQGLLHVPHTPIEISLTDVFGAIKQK